MICFYVLANFNVSKSSSFLFVCCQSLSNVIASSIWVVTFQRSSFNNPLLLSRSIFKLLRVWCPLFSTLEGEIYQVFTGSEFTSVITVWLNRLGCSFLVYAAPSSNFSNKHNSADHTLTLMNNGCFHFLLGCLIQGFLVLDGSVWLSPWLVCTFFHLRCFLDIPPHVLRVISLSIVSLIIHFWGRLVTSRISWHGQLWFGSQSQKQSFSSSTQ